MKDKGDIERRININRNNRYHLKKIKKLKKNPKVGDLLREILIDAHKSNLK